MLTEARLMRAACRHFAPENPSARRHVTGITLSTGAATCRTNGNAGMVASIRIPRVAAS
jgi:hypothetical protein